MKLKESSAKIFLVTPCLNAASTIKKTIQSVIEQTSSTYLRYHIQDGGSTDGTQKIIEEYELLIKNTPEYAHIDFSWYSAKDNGMYDAISKGFQLMDIPKDSFMGWLNADDILFPDALKNITEITTKYPSIQWFGGRLCTIDLNDNIISTGNLDLIYPQFLLQHGCCDGIHYYFIQQEGSFWKKDIYDAVSGLNTSLRFAGDWDLWRRMAKKSPFVYCPFFIGAFRKRPGQLSSFAGYNDEVNSIVSSLHRKKITLYFMLFKSSITVTKLIDHVGYERERERERDLVTEKVKLPKVRRIKFTLYALASPKAEKFLRQIERILLSVRNYILKICNNPEWS